MGAQVASRDRESLHENGVFDLGFHSEKTSIPEKSRRDRKIRPEGRLIAREGEYSRKYAATVPHMARKRDSCGTRMRSGKERFSTKVVRK